MEGQIRRTSQNIPIGTGAGITTALLTTAFGTPRSLPAGFHAYYTDSATGLLHLVWTNGTTWYSSPIPPTLGQVYNTRKLTFVDNVANNAALYIMNGGLSTTGGYQFGKTVAITKMWVGGQPHVQSADATLTTTVYNAASTTACVVTISQNNAAAWAPLSGSYTGSVAFGASEYFGIRVVANNGAGAPTWYRVTIVIEYTETA